MLNLKDLKKEDINYNWKTIYIGIEERFFNISVLTDYAIELLEKGEESPLINDLAWDVSEDNIFNLMSEIKKQFFPDFEKDNPEWQREYRKLRYVYLSKVRGNTNDKRELLNKIASFYDSFGYPEDMVSLINYMPQKLFSTQESLLENFNTFLEEERIYLKN
ncbi:DUF2247 family protein [Bacillus sp. 166amftsu]|uniref:DUF2247 family protein n=1 Tax=Bacillus sp. 166amftsu TaxID=1761753 RepID=UPI00089C33F7|nr:DUF2247 family protein [Bacillus sp. 166amftsu]SDY79349.1 hypothetical protein SAMN04488156_102418 [Bacillus sp. 166amftsu]